MSSTTTLFTSAETDEWLTPPEIADRLGVVDLDPCWSPLGLVQARTVASLIPGIEINGLDIPWTGTTFVNMPYSGLAKWLAKCRQEAERGVDVIALPPLRAEVRGFHDHVWGKARVCMLRGRLSFWLPIERAIEKARASKYAHKEVPRLEALQRDGACIVRGQPATFASCIVHWSHGIAATAIEETFADMGVWV